jgi:hypothetical protein
MKRLRLETLQSEVTVPGDAPISLTAMARVRSSAQLPEGLPRLGAGAEDWVEAYGRFFPLATGAMEPR